MGAIVSEQTPSDWRTRTRRRHDVLAAVFAGWALVIVARLVYLQIVEHDELVLRAERQQQRTIDAPAKRGEIYDRNGRLLAYSVDADTIYAVPNEVGDATAAAAKLCAALEGCDRKERAALAERFGRTGRSFVFVRRRVSPGEAQKVAALALPGIGFTKESKRFYPNRELGSHLIGYAGLDNIGLTLGRTD